MELKELSQNDIIQEWFDITAAKPNTQLNYLAAMRKYTNFTNKTPDDLLTEAEEEIESGILMRKRKIKTYLINFQKHLDDVGLAPNTKKNLLTGVRSFYATFDIDIPKRLSRGKTANSLKKNQKIPNTEDIRSVLKYASLRNRAIVLCQTSSGMGQDEILNLKVGEFEDGYDPITKITTLQPRREKVNYDFITFLSPEASEAVNDYIEYRNRIPKSTGERYTNEIIKHRVNDKSDYLFISEYVPKKYLITFDEADRRLTPHGLMESYRELAQSAGKSTALGDWQYIRSHNMRKYFNSTLLNEGADSFFVEFLMGHKIDKTREAYFRADPDKMCKLYMRYLPFLAIEDTDVRVVETAEFVELKKENEQMKREITEIKDMAVKMKDFNNIISHAISDDPDIQKRIWAKMQQS